MVTRLVPLTPEAGFARIHGGGVPPWTSYVVGIKRTNVD
jgi:hypothetical protein